MPTPVGPAPTITKERASCTSRLEREGMFALSKQYAMALRSEAASSICFKNRQCSLTPDLT